MATEVATLKENIKKVLNGVPQTPSDQTQKVFTTLIDSEGKL